MTQAAVMGAMDFRDADVLDRHWWTRLSLVLNYLEGMNQVKLLEYRRDQLQLAIQVAGAPEERQFLVRSLQDTYNQLLHEMVPWVKTGASGLKDLMTAMRKRYVQVYGDPQDPKHQADLRKLLQYWKSNRP
jgi:hypothetical protein